MVLRRNVRNGRVRLPEGSQDGLGWLGHTDVHEDPALLIRHQTARTVGRQAQSLSLRLGAGGP
jgi:hypothetical protein